MTAVDFKDRPRPNSLHRFLEEVPNQFERCIQSVGSVVFPYGISQQFLVYGFGAEWDGPKMHCFLLTFDDESQWKYGYLPSSINAC